MQNISAYLEKFKKLTPPDDSLRTKIVQIISDLFEEEIKKEDVRLRNGIVFMSIKNSKLKSEIFLKKRKILEEIKKNFGEKVRDIR